MLDLSAAFDTVDHQSLLQVLSRRFGVVDVALNWCASYLSQRTQTVSVNDQMLGPRAVSCSVPQGSVLGPLEFTAYTEDLDDVIHNNELNVICTLTTHSSCDQHASTDYTVHHRTVLFIHTSDYL